MTQIVPKEDHDIKPYNATAKASYPVSYATGLHPDYEMVSFVGFVRSYPVCELSRVNLSPALYGRHIYTISFKVHELTVPYLPASSSRVSRLFRADYTICVEYDDIMVQYAIGV